MPLARWLGFTSKLSSRYTSSKAQRATKNFYSAPTQTAFKLTHYRIHAQTPPATIYGLCATPPVSLLKPSTTNHLPTISAKCVSTLISGTNFNHYHQWTRAGTRLHHTQVSLGQVQLRPVISLLFSPLFTISSLSSSRLTLCVNTQDTHILPIRTAKRISPSPSQTQFYKQP